MNTRIWMVLAVLSASSLAACDEGAAGKDGTAGADGTTGADGATGADGTNGEDGTSGADGADGADASSDADGDGIHWNMDCDDTDAAVGEPTLYWMDRDGDGYGHVGVENYLCEPQTGWVDNSDDCDDLEADVSPVGLEICDAIDNNCDGLIDDDDTTVDATTGWEYYVDSDGDGYGDDDTTQWACSELSGLSTLAGDCNDTTTAVGPDVEEICGNGIDDNCNDSADQCGIDNDSEPDATWNHSDGNDSLGENLAVIGDFNGDGYEDLIAGAPSADGDDYFAGEAYVLYGAATISDGDVEDGTGWHGEEYYGNFGYSVGGAGDVNGDGYDDVIVGTSNDGGVFLFYGGTSVASGNTSDTADVSLMAYNGDDFGEGVFGLTDLNADGYDEFAVSERYCGPSSSSYQSGCVHIYMGSASLAASLDDDDAAMKFQGGYENYEYFGVFHSTTEVGDWNADGITDIVFGAYSDDDAGSNAGAAYVFDGPLTAYAGLTTDSSSADATLSGSSSYEYFGWDIATDGDLNNDGYDDLAVGAYYSSQGESYGGAAYVFFGSTSGLPATEDSENADMIIYGETTSEYLGRSVAFGDFDGNGSDDFAIGGSGGPSSIGQVLLFTSNTSGSFVTADADVHLSGDSTYEAFGSDIKALDSNNDGIDDLAIGADGSDEVRLFLGSGW